MLWLLLGDAAPGVYFVLLSIGVVIGVAYLAHLCVSRLEDAFDVWDDDD